ncbi:MAG: DUF4430 domain-containing protein [Candidatus Zixiibacteriota bacterium]
MRAPIMHSVSRLIPVISILTFLAIITGCGRGQQAENRLSDTAASAQPAPQDSLVIDLVGIDSTTVLDLLLAKHRVDYRVTAGGAFVVAIGDAKNSAEYFWLYSVNDTMARVACDQYLTRTNDRVRWHYRKVGI